MVIWEILLARVWLLTNCDGDIIIIRMQEDSVHSQYLEIVWAKVKGYPWWPARLSDPTITIDKQQKYRVDFFGEASHSVVSGSMLHLFRPKYEDYSVTKSKKLLEAIRQAITSEKQMLQLKQKVRNTSTGSSRPIKIVDLVVEQASNPDQEEICKQGQLDIPKGEYSESKKENDPLESMCSLKRLRSERKMSDLEDQMYSPYKPNRHKTIRKLEKGFSCANSGGFVVPYRRYYDQKYEVRIIDLLNKAYLNKPCENDILRLVKRLDQLDKKQLFNKFIVSGIAILIKLLGGKQNPTHLTQEAIRALEQKLFQLKRQLIISLSDTKEIEAEFQEESWSVSEVDSPSSMLHKLEDDQHKRVFIQQVYRILRGRNTESSVARGESMKIFGVIENLLKMKKVSKLREILVDLCQNEVDLARMEAKVSEEEDQESPSAQQQI